MAKEKSFNPAAAQRKADKQKQIAKNKKQLQNQRNEKLARRNPERTQRQIDELKELEQRGSLRPKDQETLKQLERDLKGIRRAREALGDAAPKFAERRHDGGEGRQNARQEQLQRRQNQTSNLGKRRRGSEDAQDSDTDPEVRDIPMPRDTPPPIPRQPNPQRFTDPQVGPDGQRIPHALPTKPSVPAKPAQTVYSSGPQIRDLKKEAVKFMPTAVAAKRKQVKGEGRLLEPEEIDRLEKSGYYAAQKASEAAGEEAEAERKAVEGKVEMDWREWDEEEVDEEVRRFERELGQIYPSQAAGRDGGSGRRVEMEEVEDEGD